MAAVLRVPENASGITISFLNEFLTEGTKSVGTEDEYVIGTIEKSESYGITLPGRMYDFGKKRWRDPWYNR